MARNRFQTWALALAALCAATADLQLPAARADESGPLAALESQLLDVIAQAEPSVVSIARVPRAAPDGTASADGAGPFDSGFTPSEFGAGVIVPGAADDPDAYVLTAAHVVWGRRSWSGATVLPTESAIIAVRLASRHTLTAELVAADPRSDLAVLRLPLAEAGIPRDAAPALPFAPDAPPRKGQLVVALGNPYAIARDGSASASLGIISNVSRRPAPPRGGFSDPAELDLTIHHYGTLLTVDCRLQLGGSGGALVDRQGRLIGLTTPLAALEGYEKSAGYAVPIDVPAQRIVAALQQGFEVEYGFLGIQPGDADARQLQQLQPLAQQGAAARIRRVVPGSPAERAGLQSGDLVLAVGGVPVYSGVDLMREVGWLGPDFDARLQVLRPNERRTLEIVCRLAKWPVYDESLLVATRERHPVWRGVHIDYATARRRYLPANPLAAFPQGVVAARVDAGSPAAAAGLIDGTFIVQVAGQEISSPTDFATAVSGRSGDVELELGNGRRVTVTE